MNEELLNFTMVEEHLFFNEKNRFYSTLLYGNVNDVQMWALLLKYYHFIRKREEEDVLIRMLAGSYNGMSMACFYVNSIGVEELSLIKELYPNDTSNGFSVVEYKNKVVVITQNGDIIPGRI